MMKNYLTSKEYEISYQISSKQAKIIEEELSKVCSKKPILTNMTRFIYKNDGKYIARITNTNKKCYLDFKEDSDDQAKIKNVLESKRLYFNSNNIKLAELLLKKIGYSKYQTLIKDRKTFLFSNYKIELDYYSQPKKAIILEIKGDQKNVNQEFSKLKSTFLDK